MLVMVAFGCTNPSDNESDDDTAPVAICDPRSTATDAPCFASISSLSTDIDVSTTQEALAMFESVATCAAGTDNEGSWQLCVIPLDGQTVLVYDGPQSRSIRLTSLPVVYAVPADNLTAVVLRHGPVEEQIELLDESGASVGALQSNV
jgi:hypothetical protein